MRIGDYEVHLLATGQCALDGGAMFGLVPKVLWSKLLPADELNRVPVAHNVLLVRGRGRTVLIDTGIDPKLSDKQRQMYAVEPSRLLAELARHGVAPAEVDTVLLTHLHFDHAGGNTHREADGAIVPTFPRATYLVQAADAREFHEPSPRGSASYLPDNYHPLRQRGQLELIDGDTEVLPGITARLTGGHTAAHQIYTVSGGETTLAFCADLIPTSHHLKPAWTMGYDNFPLDLIAQKNRLLAQARAENWVLVFEHDPHVPAGRLHGDGTLEAVDLNR